MTEKQLTLIGEPLKYHIHPTTRYQGSKSKIVEWITDNTKEIRFENALDAFDGT